MSTKLSEHKDESDILSLVQRISISIHVRGAPAVKCDFNYGGLKDRQNKTGM